MADGEIFYVPGIVFSGETDEQAFERWDKIEAHNKLARERAYRNSLPMVAVREWAERRGILPQKPAVKGE